METLEQHLNSLEGKKNRYAENFAVLSVEPY